MARLPVSRIERPPRPPLTGPLTSLGTLVVVLIFMQIYATRQIANTLNLGATLHNACTIARGTLTPPPSFDQMRLALGALGPMLQPIANQADARVTDAWLCSTAGRNIWDVILTRGKTPISVLVMRRQKGDTFPRALGARVDDSSSVRLHQGDAQGYAVAGLLSGEYLGYIVSALGDSDNTALAKELVPIIVRYTQGMAK
jgi:hypothetical protein